LPLGTIAAQLVHAAGESAAGFDELPPATHAVVLAVSNEQELHSLEYKARKLGYSFHSIREPDPPYNNSLMAIGFRPVYRPLLRHYKLLKTIRTGGENV